MSGLTVRKGLLIIALELALFGPSLMGPTLIDRGARPVHNYWAETHLDDQELVKLLKEEHCYSELDLFLACVNSISNMAEKYRLVLGLDGRFIAADSQEIRIRLTEKSELEMWRAHFQSDQEITLPLSFVDMWRLLDEHYVQPEERSAVIGLGLNGFLSVFRDPHTYLIPLKMYEEVIANSESKSSGLGIMSRREPEYLYVRKVFEGSSASQAGLRRGDRILSMNQRLVREMTPREVTESLLMKDVFQLQLVVSRNGELLNKVVQKKEILAQKSVEGKMLDSARGAGLLTIHKFAKNTCNQVRQELIGLIEQNLQGLVLDLRDNPGGQVEEAACVIGLFVEKGTFLFETRYKDPLLPADQYTAEGEQVFDGPLAILINSGSASSAEIVAGSLKDLGRATLVGERSFGKGSFQDGRVWGSNKNLALFETAGLYYFASGWTPQLVGLEPDLPVKMDSQGVVREEDLYLNPIRPLDTWTGPQSLTWLYERSCEFSGQPLSHQSQIKDPLGMFGSGDQQLDKATQWLSCGGRDDRHGSL